jgi:hypothetical protein
MAAFERVGGEEPRRANKWPAALAYVRKILDPERIGFSRTEKLRGLRDAEPSSRLRDPS